MMGIGSNVGYVRHPSIQMNMVMHGRRPMQREAAVAGMVLKMALAGGNGADPGPAAVRTDFKAC